MASLDAVSITILLGSVLVLAGIMSSLVALRFGAPLLLAFLVVGMLAGENVVLASEVEEKAGPLLADINKVPDPDKRAARASALRHEVLDRLIDDELILQQATELIQ